MGKWPLPLDKPLYREQRDGWETALKEVAAAYAMTSWHKLRLIRAGQRLEQLEQRVRELEKERKHLYGDV